jgi:hypothetical protein
VKLVNEVYATFDNFSGDLSKGPDFGALARTPMCKDGLMTRRSGKFRTEKFGKSILLRPTKVH